jgi:hypothetical protein
MDWFDVMSGCFDALRAAGFELPLTVTCRDTVDGPALFECRTKGVWDDLLLEAPPEADAELDLPLFFTFTDARGALAGFFIAPPGTGIAQRLPFLPPTKGH